MKYTIEEGGLILRNGEPLNLDEILADLQRMSELESERDNLNSSIAKIRAVRGSELMHNCLEWDGLEIDEYDMEFLACTCFKPSPPTVRGSE